MMPASVCGDVAGEVVLHVGGPGFDFCAAHSGLHDGVFEPLHGHGYTVRVTVRGRPDPAGMLADFRRVKAVLRVHISRLNNRTLIATAAPGVVVDISNDTVHVRGGGARFSLPRAWVVLMPTPDTSTEAIAAYLLDRLAPDIQDAAPRADALRVTVEESGTCGATVELGWS